LPARRFSPAPPACYPVAVGAEPQLSLFEGPHLRQVRFERALDRLDLGAAAADAPPEWQPAVAALADVVHDRVPRDPAHLERLVAARRPGWPAAVERAWQRLVGRRLDASGVPAVLDGEPAAAFLLRGGEPERARGSLRRHLRRRPRDAGAWRLFAGFEPVLGAVRCAFHGGPVLPAVDHLVDLLGEDEVEPVERWLLPYAWLAHEIGLEDVRSALEAERRLENAPIPLPGDAAAFAWYLLVARGQRLTSGACGVIEARTHLRDVSRAAFRRYLARVS